MAVLRVNTDAVIVFANKLEKIHKSALPIVIRQTLNKAAFDTKKKHLEKVTDKEFEKRKKNFFKAFSRVEQAKGFDINTMVSRVGINARGNGAAKNLEQVERGGIIKDREFLPTKNARTSGDKTKLVSRKKKLSALKSNNRAQRISKGNKRGFIKAALKAGKGGTVIYGHSMYLIFGFQKGRKIDTFVKAKSIYTYEKGRTISVKPRGFMKKSALLGSKDMHQNFNRLAEKRIKKILGR